MILSKHKNLTTLLLAILFCSLFYKKSLGINVFIYETILLLIGLIIHKPKFKNTLSKLLLTGTILSGLMIVIHNSSIAKVVNICSFFLLIGAITYSHFKLIKNNCYQFTINLINGYKIFINDVFSKKKKNGKFLYYLKIIILPTIVILLFLFIYYNSNNYFAELTNSFFKPISKLFNRIPSLNFLLIFILIIGFSIAISIMYGKANKKLIKSESFLNADLFRDKKPRRNISLIALKNELKSGVFLLIVLNFMLVVFNYSDITTVWFNYNWDGGFLKGFVHTGTYLLIISLLFSIGIVLYYFRGNINFYKKSNTLKVLTYIWLIQNIILIVSLVIRNSIYIHHFALAYKRIGVYVFLIATIYGIYTILIKVKHKKSFYYLVKKNTALIYTLFISLTFFNWDVLIAKYNINSYKESFIEMEYLLSLSDKVIPHINIGNEKLNEMDSIQLQKFPFKANYFYISKSEYVANLNTKTQQFLNSYPKRSILEWNYADYKAYKELIK